MNRRLRALGTASTALLDGEAAVETPHIKAPGAPGAVARALATLRERKAEEAKRALDQAGHAAAFAHAAGATMVVDRDMVITRLNPAL